MVFKFISSFLKLYLIRFLGLRFMGSGLDPLPCCSVMTAVELAVSPITSHHNRFFSAARTLKIVSPGSF